MLPNTREDRPKSNVGVDQQHQDVTPLSAASTQEKPASREIFDDDVRFFHRAVITSLDRPRRPSCDIRSHAEHECKTRNKTIDSEATAARPTLARLNLSEANPTPTETAPAPHTQSANRNAGHFPPRNHRCSFQLLTSPTSGLAGLAVTCPKILQKKKTASALSSRLPERPPF